MNSSPAFLEALYPTPYKVIFDRCILPLMTYRLEAMALTLFKINKLRQTQRAMKEIILGLSLRDRINNEEIRHH